VFTTESAGELLVADEGLNAVYLTTTPYFEAAAYSDVRVFATPSARSPIESFIDCATGVKISEARHRIDLASFALIAG